MAWWLLISLAELWTQEARKAFFQFQESLCNKILCIELLDLLLLILSVAFLAYTIS
jgi:hypothetical protein